MAKKTSKNLLDKIDARFCEYLHFKKSVAAIRLLPYETPEVFARSILDAASEDESPDIRARIHVALPVARGGSVQVHRHKGQTICFVICRRLGRIIGNEEYISGRSSIPDPTGRIYESARKASDYITELFQDFSK